jgi:hypothetical protein
VWRQRDATPEPRDDTIDEVSDVTPPRDAQRALGLQCQYGYRC